MTNYNIATIVAAHQALIKLASMAGIDYNHGVKKIHDHFTAELNKHLPHKYFAAHDLTDGSTEYAIFDTEEASDKWINNLFDEYDETDDINIGIIKDFKEFVNEFVGDDYDSICCYWICENGLVTFSTYHMNKEALSA